MSNQVGFEINTCLHLLPLELLSPLKLGRSARSRPILSKNVNIFLPKGGPKLLKGRVPFLEKYCLYLLCEIVFNVDTEFSIHSCTEYLELAFTCFFFIY